MKWSNFRKFGAWIVLLGLILTPSQRDLGNQAIHLAPISPMLVNPEGKSILQEKIFFDFSFPFPSRFWILPGSGQTDSFGNTQYAAYHEASKHEIPILETGRFFIATNSTPTHPGVKDVIAWDKKSLKETPLKEFVTQQGDQFKRYFIFKSLGHGGMGRVDLAWDPQTQRLVAIKQLLQKTSKNKEIVNRFHREAQIMKAMNHPNVVKVIESGKVPTDYYIMEFLEGTSLKELLKRRPLTLKEAVEYTTQIAEGLEYVHKLKLNEAPLGIVHRDIKPENIFITESGRVLILDFGISHVDHLTQLTKTGNIMGTPTYMSPEQFDPRIIDDKEIDQRADIYSTGILLYTLLVGESPFKEVKSITQWMEVKNNDFVHEEYLFKGILKDKLVVEDKITEKLEAILLKASAFDREDRFQEAQELLKDLRQLQIELSNRGSKETTRLSVLKESSDETIKQMDSTLKQPYQTTLEVRGDLDSQHQLDSTVLQYPWQVFDYQFTDTYLESAL